MAWYPIFQMYILYSVIFGIDIFRRFKNGFVCIRILGGHSFLWHGTPFFKCIFCIQSYLELTFLDVVVFVKIPFQHIN